MQTFWDQTRKLESLLTFGEPCMVTRTSSMRMIQQFHYTRNKRQNCSLQSDRSPHQSSRRNQTPLHTLSFKWSTSRWEIFFNDIVDDKTIFQHSVEFAFKHLKLIEIHPASELLNRHLDITIDQSNNQLTLNYPSVVGFRYFVQSSEDLTSWSTKNTNSPMLGSGNFLSYTSQITSKSLKKFYRILVTPNF